MDISCTVQNLGKNDLLTFFNRSIRELLLQEPMKELNALRNNVNI